MYNIFIESVDGMLNTDFFVYDATTHTLTYHTPGSTDTVTIPNVVIKHRVHSGNNVFFTIDKHSTGECK